MTTILRTCGKWRETNPRELLRRIVEDNPHDAMDRLFVKFETALKNSSNAMQSSVDCYYFYNNVGSLLSIAPRSSPER
jgi:hypothetical protein